MKLFSPFFLLLFVALFSSCNKDDNENLWQGGPAIEIRFVNNYSMAKKVATRASQPSLDYEKRITSLVLLAYPQGAGVGAAPVIKYPFSPDECTNKMAVIPLGTVAPSTVLDFYVVANCSVTHPALASSDPSEPTLGALKAMSEANPVSRYNNGTLSGLMSGVNIPYDFAMSAYRQVTTMASGYNKPTVVEMALNRTVARVDVGVSVSTQFKTNYPTAILDIKYAAITYYADDGVIIESAVKESTDESIANMHTPADMDDILKDSFKQDNGSSATTIEGKFRYYLYSNGDRNNDAVKFDGGSTVLYDPTVHKNVLLTVVAEFDYDGKTATTTDRKTIKYRVPLEGDALKGGFSRNVLYDAIVKINGITEQEIRADISVADWQSVVTQNVSIGG